MGKIRGAVNNLVSSGDELKRSLWQRWNNPSGRSTPAFLVGCGRSGTSMIVHQLDKSWRIDLFNEDNPAAFEKWRLRDLEVIAGLMRDSSAEIVVFKPILNTHQTRDLLAKFPESRVIFTFRQYDDVINSSLKRFGVDNRLNHIRSWMSNDFGEFKSADPPQETKQLIRSLWRPELNAQSGAALYWLFYNRLYYDLHLDQENRALLTRYETIVADPERHFKTICAFLGISYEPNLAEGVFASSIRRDPSPDIDPQVNAACEDLWQRLCQDEQLAQV